MSEAPFNEYSSNYIDDAGRHHQQNNFLEIPPGNNFNSIQGFLQVSVPPKLQAKAQYSLARQQYASLSVMRTQPEETPGQDSALEGSQSAMTLKGKQTATTLATHKLRES